MCTGGAVQGQSVFYDLLLGKSEDISEACGEESACKTLALHKMVALSPLLLAA